MKQRLDLLLVERGLAASRSQAAAMIMAGEVSSQGRRLDKAGQLVEASAKLDIKQRPRYVSRGGDKLASVVDELGLDFSGLTVLDVGASTGGFTDFALKHGARQVFALDVGRAQLDQRLRTDPRVTVMEKTDVREAKLPQPADLAVIDVAFISLTKILDAVGELVKPDGQIVAMAKPQFEAGKALADKFKGVIPEPERSQVLQEFRDWVQQPFEILSEADSKIAGSRGNVERFFLLRKRG